MTKSTAKPTADWKPVAQQSSAQRKAALRQASKNNRSTWPRAPRHGKHAEVQGFPGTRTERVR